MCFQQFYGCSTTWFLALSIWFFQKTNIGSSVSFSQVSLVYYKSVNFYKDSLYTADHCMGHADFLLLSGEINVLRFDAWPY